MADKIIIHEKALESCVVKILSPNGYEMIGTSFFCHPHVYILTCYHVIKPYIAIKQKKVLLFYNKIRLKAQICEEYCIKQSDIAALKVTELQIPQFYASLDIHDRWSIDDRICSYGYPEGYFEGTGIGLTGTIGGTTKIEEVNVVQINGLSLCNVKPGYSGSPVLHLRTKKIIGLIQSIGNETQAFFVPIKIL